MGLESASFLSQLVSSNPPGGDNVSQGDDHIRLLKNVLQGTFPDADRAFYLNQHQDSKSAGYTVVGTDDGKMIVVDATAGAVTIDLTAIASLWNGFNITIMKIDSSSNAVTIDPNLTETINGQSTLVLDQQYEGVKLWTSGSGSAWYGLVHPIPFLTTRGDLLIYTSAGISRVALGAAATYLRSDGTDALWTAIQQGDLPVMTGANGVSAGAKGAVPQPAATDNLKILFGDATWGLAKGLIAATVFTSSGTWTKDSAQVNMAEIWVGGAGGGGSFGAADTPDNRSNGAAGGWAFKYLDVTAISSRTVTIGAGGNDDNSNTSPGGTGGTTSFGSDVSATGGTGGNPSNDASGTPGAGSNGTLNFTGRDPNYLYWSDVGAHGFMGANCGYGAGGRGGTIAAETTAGQAGICVVLEYGT